MSTEQNSILVIPRHTIRVNYINAMFKKYQKLKQLAPTLINQETGEAFTRDFYNYFRMLAEDAAKTGQTRKLPYYNSVQTSLSNFKRLLKDSGETNISFLNTLHIKPKHMKLLKKMKTNAVHAKAIDLPLINGDAVVLKCREYLNHNNPYLQLTALACLTGRRSAEILHSINFQVPRETHYTPLCYWTCGVGFVKIREDQDNKRSQEFPLLASRDKINEVLTTVRLALPATSVKQVNRKYGKQIQRTMRKYFPLMRKMHDFRKLYALICFHYFNERHCSLPRLASDYLAHLTMSESILTYLNFRVSPLGQLDFTQCN